MTEIHNISEDQESSGSLSGEGGKPGSSGDSADMFKAAIHVVKETVIVNKEGPWMHWCPLNNYAEIQFPDGEGVTDATEAVPEHPDGVEGTQALDDRGALCCTEQVMLEDDADPTKVYVKNIGLEGESKEFVHVVYFTGDTADEAMAEHGHVGGRLVGGDGIVQHMKGLSGQFKSYCRNNSEAVSSSSNGATQAAKGAYLELGIGAMAGRTRTSVSFPQERAGKPSLRSNVPFKKAPRDFSDQVEDILGRIVASASIVARMGLPTEVWEAVRMRDFARDTLTREDDMPSSLTERFNRAYQYPCPPVYPRTYDADLMVSSHQVALRGTMPDIPGESYEERETKCEVAVSNLHVDKGDTATTGALYSCEKTTTEVLEEGVTDALRWRDIVVFPGRGRTKQGALRRGGRGARIRVLRPGWFCWVFFSTRDCLHGGVTQNSEETHCIDSNSWLNPAYRVSMQLTGLDCMRCITYPMQMIYEMLTRLSESKRARIETAPKIWGLSCYRMQRRMRDARKVRDTECILNAFLEGSLSLLF